MTAGRSRQPGLERDAIAAAAYRHITTATRRLTPEMLHDRLHRELDVDRRSSRRAIDHLVLCGQVQYTYEFGCSFLVSSVNRPVAVSRRVVLVPQGFTTALGVGQVSVILSHGAAFGTGSHPSTRLAVRGIDHILSPFPEGWKTGESRILDVGTGSGVLLLTALKLGMAEGVGIDLDPCALAEGRFNATLNGLSMKARFGDASLAGIAGKFRLVTANLRLPTLVTMAPALTDGSLPDARLVISGIREVEAQPLEAAYRRLGWAVVWASQDAGWAGAVFRRSAG